MKILLFIVLSMLTILQYVLIYSIGDFIDLFESFGTDLPNFSEWVIAMSKTKTIWLIPKFNFIIGALFVIKEKYPSAMMMVFIAFMIIGALLWAMYSPTFFNNGVVLG